MSPKLLVPLCYTSEAGLGRFNIALLSQQTQMELLIDEFSYINKQDFVGPDGYLDIADWSSLRRNAKGEVTHFRWEYASYDTDNLLRLEYLPASVLSVQLPGDSFAGQLDCQALPRGMQHFDLSQNHFSGSVYLSDLPCSMQTFLLYANKFDGTLDLASLPDKLEELSLSCNFFSGSVFLSSLPPSLCILDLHENKLSGTIDLTRLPASLRTLVLATNRFSGSLNLLALPDSLNDLSLEDNQFTGSVVLTLRHDQQIDLSGNDISQVVDTAGTPVDHPFVMV